MAEITLSCLRHGFPAVSDTRTSLRRTGHPAVCRAFLELCLTPGEVRGGLGQAADGAPDERARDVDLPRGAGERRRAAESLRAALEEPRHRGHARERDAQLTADPRRRDADL